jgi:hypothetical protein
MSVKQTTKKAYVRDSAIRLSTGFGKWSSYMLFQFYGAFAKLRKATTSIAKSVCPSAHMGHSVPTGQIFIKFDI